MTMIFVHQIDLATGMFIEDTFFDDGETVDSPALPLPADMISDPVPSGLGWPKWDGLGWVEGKDPDVLQAHDASRLLSSLTAAVQMHLDRTAKARGYDGILSACTYATDTHPPFQAEGQACVNWRGEVWAACYQIMTEVKAGTHAMPTEDSLIAELPLMVWPV